MAWLERLLPSSYCAPGEGYFRQGIVYRPRASEGSAERPLGANSLAWNLGHAAAAIMAALSVERARVGNETGTPRAAASAVKRARSSRLAATPPVTRMRRTPRDSAAAKVFLRRSPTTACWKLAMRSSVCGSQVARASSMVSWPRSGLGFVVSHPCGKELRMDGASEVWRRPGA